MTQQPLTWWGPGQQNYSSSRCLAAGRTLRGAVWRLGTVKGGVFARENDGRDQCVRCGGTDANDEHETDTLHLSSQDHRCVFKPCHGCGPCAEHSGERKVTWVLAGCPTHRGSRRSRQRGATGIQRHSARCRAITSDILFLAVTCLLCNHLGGAMAGRVKSADRRMMPGHEQIVQLEKASLAKPAAVPGVVLAGRHAQYRSVFVPVQRFTPVKLAVRWTLYVCVCMYTYIHTYIYIHARARAHTHTNAHTHTHDSGRHLRGLSSRT